MVTTLPIVLIMAAIFGGIAGLPLWMVIGSVAFALLLIWKAI